MGNYEFSGEFDFKRRELVEDGLLHVFVKGAPLMEHPAVLLKILGEFGDLLHHIGAEEERVTVVVDLVG